jgi:hypothetical protein
MYATTFIYKYIVAELLRYCNAFLFPEKSDLANERLAPIVGSTPVLRL